MDSNPTSNRISLPRVTVMGRQLEDTEPDYMACYTSYEVARDALASKDREIERLRAALERYGRHAHPNCHDLTLKQDGSFGPRNGCLCGLDAILSGDSSAPETSASIPARPYPGDEAAVREAGITLPYCTCHRASDDPHKNGCPFWDAILAARKSWHDKNVVAWSCSQEARGRQRCKQWCGHPEFCTATGTDRRKSSAQETTENPGAGAPGGVGVVDLAARSSAQPSVHVEVSLPNGRRIAEWETREDGSHVKASVRPENQCLHTWLSSDDNQPVQCQQTAGHVGPHAHSTVNGGTDGA